MMLSRTPLLSGVSAAGGAVTSGSVILSNSNGISFGVNGNTITASHNAITTGRASNDAIGLNTAQTNVTWTVNSSGLSLNAGGYAGTGFTSTTTAGANIVGTNNTAGLSVGVPAFLTTAMASNRGTDFVQANAGFNGTNASGTIASNAISVSVAAQSAQTQNLHNLTLSGNTAGVMAQVSSGTLTLAGGNNITLSQNGNAITISGANAGGVQTAISGLVVSDTTYTSGTVSFSNAGNITIGSSVDGATQYIRLSGVAAQTNQSAIRAFGVSNTGQTAGNTGVSTGVDWVLAGSNSITLSQSTAAGGPNTVWVQHPAWITTAMQSNAATISNIRVSGGTTSNLLSALTFADSNGISFGLNASTLTASHNALTTAMASNRGSDFVQANAGFNGTNASGTIASNAISVSVAAPFAGSQSIGASNLGNTLGTSGVASGSQVRFLIAASNGMMASQSVDGASATISLINSWSTATTVSVVASANVLGADAGRFALEGHQHAGVISAGVSNVGNTAGNTTVRHGNFVLAGSNALTLSQETAAAGANTIHIQGPLSATTISAVQSANSIGTRGSRFALEDHYHAGVPAIAAGSTTGNTAGNTATQFGTWVIAGSNSITISGSTGGAGIHTLWIQQTGGGGAFSGGVSTGGNTAGDTGITGTRLVFAGGNNITVSQATDANGATISVVAPNLGAGAMSVGVSTGGNTAGATGITGTQLVLVGLNAVSLSQTTGANGGTVSFNVAANNTGGFFENYDWDAALSASTTVGLSTGLFVPVAIPQTLAWNNVGVIASASLPVTSCGNTISLSFGTSGQSQQVDHFYSFTNSGLYDLYLLSRGASGSSTDLVTVSSTRNSVVTFFNETWRHLATAGAASQTVSASNSVSLGISFPAMTSATSTSVNAATTVTLWGTGYSSWGSTASGSTSSTKTTGATISVSIASTYPATTVWASNKFLQMNWGAGVVIPGQYWVGLVRGSSTSSSSSSASTSGAAGRSYTTAINMTDLTMTAQLTYVGQTNTIASSLGTFGGNTLASLGMWPGLGTYSATYAGSRTYMNNAGQANGEIALSDIATNVSYFRPWMQFNSNRV